MSHRPLRIAEAPHDLGDLDLHLFNEGTHSRLYDVLGAHPTAGATRFAVWAPSAEAVGVIGDFNHWTDPVALTARGSSGIWEGAVRGGRWRNGEGEQGVQPAAAGAVGEAAGGPAGGGRCGGRGSRWEGRPEGGERKFLDLDREGEPRGEGSGSFFSLLGINGAPT